MAISNNGVRPTSPAGFARTPATMADLIASRLGTGNTAAAAATLADKKFEELDLSGIKLDLKALQTLADALRQPGVHVRSLKLAGCFIHFDGDLRAALPQLLGANSTLTHLDLSCNVISTETAQTLADSLANSRLQSLTLEQTNLDLERCILIAKGVQPGLGDDGKAPIHIGFGDPMRYTARVDAQSCRLAMDLCEATRQSGNAGLAAFAATLLGQAIAHRPDEAGTPALAAMLTRLGGLGTWMKDQKQALPRPILEAAYQCALANKCERPAQTLSRLL
jgi:hypothetical protein